MAGRVILFVKKPLIDRAEKYATDYIFVFQVFLKVINAIPKNKMGNEPKTSIIIYKFVFGCLRLRIASQHA